MVSKRLVLVAAIATLAVAGCAGEAKRSEMADATAPSEESVVTAEPAPPAEPAPAPKATVPATPSTETAPVLTGILVCDDYLSHYKACHRTLKLFDEQQIENRYQEISSVLATDARNAALRDDVEQRCNALELTMKEQLDGRECQFEETPLASDESDEDLTTDE